MNSARQRDTVAPLSSTPIESTALPSEAEALSKSVTVIISFSRELWQLNVYLSLIHIFSMGKIMIRGRRHIICLVRERNIPRLALPMEVKKVDVMGWIPFKKVQNM